MISIQNHATPSTNMCPNAKRLVHNSVTVGAFLAGIVRWYSDDWNSMQRCIVFQPLQEDPPSCIMDRFGKLAISDHVLNLKVFVGIQVVRRDNRVCLLSAKILTLPLDFHMLLRQFLSSFLSVRRFLVLTRKSSLEIGRAHV